MPIKSIKQKPTTSVCKFLPPNCCVGMLFGAAVLLKKSSYAHTQFCADLWPCSEGPSVCLDQQNLFDWCPRFSTERKIHLQHNSIKWMWLHISQEPRLAHAANAQLSFRRGKCWREEKFLNWMLKAGTNKPWWQGASLNYSSITVKP